MLLLEGFEGEKSSDFLQELMGLEERLRMSGKTPTFQHANGASIRARAVPLRILIPRAQLASTCISRPTASLVGIPCAVVALRGRKRGHFGKKVV